MALILPFKDLTHTEYSDAFMKTLVNIDITNIKVELSFWANFQAYKNGAKMLFTNQPIILSIPRSSKLYQDKFDIRKISGKATTSIIFYDEILKKIDGTDDSITFYTGNIIDKIDQRGVVVGKEQEIDIILHTLKGIDFTKAIDSFTQKEIDLEINGLADLGKKDEAKIIFNETLELFQIYKDSTWFNQ